MYSVWHVTLITSAFDTMHAKYSCHLKWYHNHYCVTVPGYVCVCVVCVRACVRARVRVCVCVCVCVCVVP